MASLELRGGISVLFDDSDSSLVAAVNWVPALCGKKNKRPYAIGWSKSLKRSVFMHRIVMGAAPGDIVDHINGDAMDNRRANLRLCTPTENNGNSRWPVGISGYRGVAPYNKSGKWRARISIDGRMVNIGTADSKDAAARLYDAAAIHHFGEFATLNFPRLA